MNCDIEPEAGIHVFDTPMHWMFKSAEHHRRGYKEIDALYVVEVVTQNCAELKSHRCIWLHVFTKACTIRLREAARTPKKTQMDRNAAVFRREVVIAENREEHTVVTRRFPYIIHHSL